ncbi:MAG TPA: hypothetical protein PLK77_05930 [Pyrinomonadaceae bacterium]|nr:hypothetical protein [Pyrinomonadaceae bacterium]
MFQFQAYPIYVVYSLNRQKTVEPLWRQYSNEMRRAKNSAEEGRKTGNMDRFHRQTEVARQSENLIYATWDWELIEDLDSKYGGEIRAYEQTIRLLLMNIAATRVGSILLNTIKKSPPNTKIWIIPANWDAPTATTRQYSDIEGGGIRIFFKPSAWGRAAEQTLVHELVHAKRLAFNQYNAQPFRMDDPGIEFVNSEEFLATQIENIQGASRKISSKYHSYHGPDRDKSEMYKFFSEYADFPRGIKHFIDTDPMVKEMAGLMNPEYNPFRDLEQIKKAGYVGEGEMISDWK